MSLYLSRDGRLTSPLALSTRQRRRRLALRLLIVSSWVLAIILVPFLAVQTAHGEELPPASALVAAINVARSQATPACDPLVAVATLTTAAQTHSTAMAGDGFLGDITPSGHSPMADAAAAGYAGSLGVVVAGGPATADALLAAWLPTPAIHAQLLDCASTSIGVGYVTDLTDAAEILGVRDGGASVVLIDGPLTHYWTVLIGAHAVVS